MTVEEFMRARVERDDEIVSWLGERADTTDRKLLALHEPGSFFPISPEQAADPEGWEEPWRRCDGHDWQSWPCPEVRIIASKYGRELPGD